MLGADFNTLFSQPACDLRIRNDFRASPDRDALLDQKSADLIDRRRSARDQAGANAVESLEVELVLRLPTRII